MGSVVDKVPTSLLPMERAPVGNVGPGVHPWKDPSHFRWNHRILGGRTMFQHDDFGNEKKNYKKSRYLLGILPLLNQKNVLVEFAKKSEIRWDPWNLNYIC